jgi:hypothetical protein
MATGQKISTTTYHHGMLELENYNKLLPAEKGIKSDDSFPRA